MKTKSENMEKSKIQAALKRDRCVHAFDNRENIVRMRGISRRCSSQRYFWMRSIDPEEQDRSCPCHSSRLIFIFFSILVNYILNILCQNYAILTEDIKFIRRIWILTDFVTNVVANSCSNNTGALMLMYISNFSLL